VVYNKEGEKIVELDKKISVDINIEIAKEVPIVPAVRGDRQKITPTAYTGLCRKRRGFRDLLTSLTLLTT